MGSGAVMRAREAEVSLEKQLDEAAQGGAADEGADPSPGEALPEPRLREEGVEVVEPVLEERPQRFSAGFTRGPGDIAWGKPSLHTPSSMITRGSKSFSFDTSAWNAMRERRMIAQSLRK